MLNPEVLGYVDELPRGVNERWKQSCGAPWLRRHAETQGKTDAHCVEHCTCVPHRSHTSHHLGGECTTC